MSKSRSNDHKKAQNEVKKLEGFRCFICGYVGEEKDGFMEGHHLIPVQAGGGSGRQNMITLCRTCHQDYHSGKLKIDIRRF
jgi:5-methylcytosine-specific restriction endonuclease McrA